MIPVSDASTITVYLDQSRWIQLLRAVPGDTKVERAMKCLGEAVEASSIIVPLSASHYQETWNAHDWKRRWALAGLMRDLSKWHTLAPIQTVTAMEIGGAFDGRPVEPRDVLGRGVNYAFDCEHGRFIPVRQWPAGLYPTDEVVEEATGLEELKARPELWEWGNLAGPPLDFPLTGFAEGDGLDFRPEHDRGDDWVDWETGLQTRIDAAGLSHRLHDGLMLESIASMLDELNEAAEVRGIDTRPFLLPPIEGPRRFHASLPARSVFVDLQYFRLNERQFTPEQHDRMDLLAHAVAFAYCDVVVTENRLADLARKARVSERFGTVVLRKLEELPRVLERIT